MSLKIKKTTGEIFDLPPDYVIEAEKNNPLFTDKGSQTVSIAFPNTGNNRKLLEYAHRLDKAIKPPKTIPVVVESGILHQSGLLSINSGSDKSISANIGWDESEIYAGMMKMQLRDMPILDMPEYTKSFGGSSVDERVDFMLAHLTNVMKEEFNMDYCVFPLILSQDKGEIPGLDGNPTITTYYEVLNDYVKFSEEPFMPTGGAFGDLLALKERKILRYVDGKMVLFDAPKGYGVSAFLKVWRLLEIVFKNYGLSLENNPFKTQRQLKRLVVLNNTMDAILTGRLHYKDMMPDITVKEFLDSLYNKFGLQYFVNSNTKSVALLFWRDILTPNQTIIDFSRYKAAPFNINYTEAKQLKLAANREIKGTEVKWNTFEEFLKAYEYQFSELFGDETLAWHYTSRFDAAMRYYSIVEFENPSPAIVSSDFFDWDKKDDLAYEEIKMTDLCLPIERYTAAFLLNYHVGYKHIYSDVEISGETIKGDAGQNKAKLAFAFGWGKTNLPGVVTYNYFFASQDNRNEHGRFINDPNGLRYDISLTCHRRDGLYNRFWKEYDAFLRHSNHIVDLKLNLPELEILKLKMFQRIHIDNQPLLIEQVKFKPGRQNAETDFKLRTLRLYQPYDLDSERKIEAYHPQKYYWRSESVRNPDIENELDSKKIPYVVGEVSPEDKRSLLWLPPSEDEYERQVIRIYEFDYVVRYREHPMPSPTITVNVHCVITYYPTLIE